MVSMKLFTTTSTLVILVVLGLSLEMVTAEDCDLPSCAVISGQEVRCKNPYAWFEYHPHPTNPNLYVQCTRYGPQDSNGDGVITPHEQACAPGTTYNQAIKRCT
ncbi:hypothetical protein Hamer_G020654 [Homarus americanus]|uniref:Secreted protein n=1 Tax=Homarus americanus TaxID=6706 RepID=A0A8J5K835_HOMAM|nr:hypothetical protein Hamer_G020652 [Homarus americanus]KAG7169170.1 hypothetical protein Hamer_G020654 [Homarus americanus]